MPLIARHIWQLNNGIVSVSRFLSLTSRIKKKKKKKKTESDIVVNRNSTVPAPTMNDFLAALNALRYSTIDRNRPPSTSKARITHHAAACVSHTKARTRRFFLPRLASVCSIFHTSSTKFSLLRSYSCLIQVETVHTDTECELEYYSLHVYFHAALVTRI